MKFKARFDTLFGRLAILIVAVLVLSHFSWLGILRTERRERQFQASVDQMAFQLQAFQAVADGRLQATLPDLVSEAAGPPAGNALSASDKSVELARQLLRRLPAGRRSGWSRAPRRVCLCTCRIATSGSPCRCCGSMRRRPSTPWCRA